MFGLGEDTSGKRNVSSEWPSISRIDVDDKGLHSHKGSVIFLAWKGCYDEVSANGAIWVPKTSDFQSGHRVVNNMLHTWYYVYVVNTDFTVVFFKALPHTAAGLTSHYMYRILLPLAPALIPIQSLVVQPCIPMTLYPHLCIFPDTVIVVSDNKCLQAIRTSLICKA